MAHNDFVAGGTGSGAWTGVTVVHAMMEKFDQRQFEAVNGDLGGTWAPSSILTIGGQGFELAGTNHQVTGTLTVNSGGFLTFASGSKVTSNATLLGTWTYGDGSVGVGHAASVVVAANSSLTIGGVSTVNGNLTANNSTWALVGTIVNMSGAGQLNLGGTSSLAVGVTAGIVNSGTLSQAAGSHLDFASAADITGIALLKGVIANSGAGHTRKRFTTGTDGAATYGVNATDVLTFTGIFFTADHTNVITSTGAGEGSEIIVALGASSGGHLITFVRDDTTTICSLHGTAASAISSARLAFRGGTWTIAEMTPNGH